MKSLPWILAAVGVGAAAYILYNTPGPKYATGSSDIEGAARSTSQWGSKSRLRGAGGKFVGKAKEAFGNATGNADIANEGRRRPDRRLGQGRGRLARAGRRTNAA